MNTYHTHLRWNEKLSRHAAMLACVWSALPYSVFCRDLFTDTGASDDAIAALCAFYDHWWIVAFIAVIILYSFTHNDKRKEKYQTALIFIPIAEIICRNYASIKLTIENAAAWFGA